MAAPWDPENRIRMVRAAAEEVNRAHQAMKPAGFQGMLLEVAERRFPVGYQSVLEMQRKIDQPVLPKDFGAWEQNLGRWVEASKKLFMKAAQAVATQKA